MCVSSARGIVSGVSRRVESWPKGVHIKSTTMRASVQQARVDTCSTCLLFIQQRAQGTCQLATIAHCAMSCQGQQEQCASHPALSNKARSGIRCRTCVLLCAGRSACVSSAQVMCQPTLPLHGDGQGSFTLTMVPVLTSLGNVCTSASLLSVPVPVQFTLNQ